MTLPRVRIHARRWLATVAAFLAFAAPAAAASPTTATFEGGAPAGFFVFNGGASSVTTATAVVNEGEPLDPAGPGRAQHRAHDAVHGGGLRRLRRGLRGRGIHRAPGLERHGRVRLLVLRREQRAPVPGRDPGQPLEPERGHRGALRLRLRRRLHRLALHPHTLRRLRARHRLPARGRAQRRPDPDRDVGLGGGAARHRGVAHVLHRRRGPDRSRHRRLRDRPSRGHRRGRGPHRLLHVPGRLQHGRHRHREHAARARAVGGGRAEQRAAARLRRDVLRRRHPQLPGPDGDGVGAPGLEPLRRVRAVALRDGQRDRLSSWT